jgi:carboxyl-terminal processing protease
MVVRPSTGGPADNAGLRPKDLIVAVAGEQFEGLAAFYQAVWNRGPAGVEIRLTIIRSGDRLTVSVVSGSRYEHLKLGP